MFVDTASSAVMNKESNREEKRVVEEDPRNNRPPSFMIQSRFNTLWGEESARGHSNHMYTECSEVEKLLNDCLHVSGVKRAHTRCKPFYEDFNECRFQIFRVSVASVASLFY